MTGANVSNRRVKAATAIEMAARQRDISVSEFFLKNRHLLGFDTPSKALVTAVKEAVDNSIDACEEAGILPHIIVEVNHHHGICRIAVEDNGPGIVEGQIARIYGKLLYGSKFHKLAQSRGQQGMGISAAGMYGQLTVGKPLHIVSRVEGEDRASELVVSIDTKRNRPDIHRKSHVYWDRPHGTRVEMAIEGHYQKGPHSVESYLKLAAIANPHVTLEYVPPDGERIGFLRSVYELPPRPAEIKPHPEGVELGRLIQMLGSTACRTLLKFLVDEFSSIGRKTALAIIDKAGGKLSARSYPKHIARAQATALHRAIRRTSIPSPRTDCIVPIGEEQLLAGLHKELEADFYTATTRPAAAYQGNPFQVEAALAYGRPGEADIKVYTSGRMRKVDDPQRSIARHLIAGRNEPVRLLRFANRVPLLYQQQSCAITRAVTQTNWRTYGLTQHGGALPIAPMAIIVHVASVWIPYTSEAKEAVEPYPEILKEIKLALQQCGRDLAQYLRRRNRLEKEYGKRVYIEKYLPHIGLALQDILMLDDAERDRTVDRLDEVLHRTRTTHGSDR